MKSHDQHREWSDRYRAALTRHLQRGRAATMASARGLGRTAVKLKLETLDVARMHELALLDLASRSPSGRAGQKTIRTAKLFFTETIVPIEKTRLAAMKAALRIADLTQQLRQRTVESAESNRALKHGIARRRSAEAALTAQSKQLARLLRESNHLQQQLRGESRRALSGQEGERIRTSCRLHEDIVQALVAIKLRLLTLRKRATANMASLKKEVAGTERLVKQSVKSIERLTHEIDRYHES